MNHIIIMTENEIFNTDSFYYNKDEHYINYHIPYGDSDSWGHKNNIKCTIENMSCNLILKVTEIKEAAK